MENALEQFASAASDLEAVPAEGAVAALREKAVELAELDSTINNMEATLKQFKKQRYELQSQTLPDIMRDVGVDIIGVPEAGVDVVLKNYCKASIPVGWPEDKKKRAFSHLEELGGEDIIQMSMTLSTGRGMHEQMNQLANRVRQLAAEYEIPGEVVLAPSVRWNTLTAFIKECIKNGDAVDFEAVGCTYGEVVEIKPKED